MQDFEKLGLFYLGREYDLDARRTTPTPVLYDSRDLVTHAVCVGMTGSGKTGLCIGLLEEALIDGVPVIAIDPKGDLGNLRLTFPGLSPADFRPWIDEDEARRAGESPEAYAAGQARAWSEGLAAWGQDGERIRRLKESGDVSLYTPGSRAGRSVSVLSSFAAPPDAVRNDSELLGDRAGSTATSVLALAGAPSEPRSREHTLVASLLVQAWRAGRSLQFADLIAAVQKPPFDKVGVMDLESFFPEKDRFALALALNGVLAAPGFDEWFEGEPLDPASLLWTRDGKPRISIFSIAHLGDAERMFFVSLLLNAILGWMRTQAGTSSLRAIVYMDEIAGYFPPVATPPSKAPLLTLLKQARAFGVGIVLATQNPVDLDYKGLANTGTWFLGRLQTERDKARVLDGLEGAAAGALDRAEAGRILSTLGKRVFLLHNVHESAPVVFQTRWTLSYLRGPLSREQVRQLTAGTAGQGAESSTPPPAQQPGVSGASPSARVGARPLVPPGIEQYFLPGPDADRGSPAYAPVVLGAARITYRDAKLGVDESRDLVFAAPVHETLDAPAWEDATSLDLRREDLRREPASPEARFSEVPSAAMSPGNYSRWQKTFSTWLAGSQRMDLLRHAETKLTARPGEAEREFLARVHDALRVRRDDEVEAVRKRFATKRDALLERIRKARATKAREEQQVSHQRTQTILTTGASLLGAFFGRRKLSAATLGRASTAARSVGRSMKEAADVQRAEENIAALDAQLQALETAVNEETSAIAARYSAPIALERVPLAPKRGGIVVHFVALGWEPV